MIDYDGRRFRAGSDARAPIATYHHSGDLVWAEFDGGDVRRGSLVGAVRDDDSLRFSYSMLLASGELVSGLCVSVPELLPDGRVRLHETYQRLGEQPRAGTSWIEELPDAPAPP